jgi:hypothetical protein
LANVQIYSEQVEGNVPVINEDIAKERKSELALSLVRRNDFN